tara:strand:- start:73 stop:744 length:672 start_codon:yes stop_codon:yes gene_type:complete
MSWIQETAKKGKQMNNFYSFDGTDVYIMHALPENVNIEEVLGTVSKRVPSHLKSGIDVIYVGQFQSLVDREVNAVFEDGAIYITNDQDNVEDMVDDLVHELAHSVETEHPNLIFEDGRLFKEFIGKRRRLTSMLEAHGFDVDPIFRARPEFNQKIDDFLYKEVGYDLLANLIIGLFPGPYSTTSLREYFAVGFEEFFIGDRKYLKQTCPILYTKLESLASLGG